MELSDMFLEKYQCVPPKKLIVADNNIAGFKFNHKIRIAFFLDQRDPVTYKTNFFLSIFFLVRYMINKQCIGIVGGVGPYAGLDLERKIFEHTQAVTDQDHLNVINISKSCAIEDRTAFLLGQIKKNPADSISAIIQEMAGLGVVVVGIPCNTAHAPLIFNSILKNLKKVHAQVKLVNMVEETVAWIRIYHEALKKIGILSTTRAYKVRLYPNILEKYGMEAIMVNEKIQKTVHNAIYNKIYGIKAKQNPVSNIAQIELIQAVRYLQKRGAQAIILGCTEIPLAINGNFLDDTILIDPTTILARSLIRIIDPNKLKSWNLEASP